ncbi:exonuclease domain-containing protein, partial [Klebsiella pneumoniae]
MLTYHQSVLKMMMANWLRSDYVIIDTETTGLKDFDEIIEITIINMRGEILLNSLVKPSRLIPPGVTEINNITN